MKNTEEHYFNELITGLMQIEYMEDKILYFISFLQTKDVEYKLNIKKIYLKYVILNKIMYINEYKNTSFIEIIRFGMMLSVWSGSVSI